jgi:hypothetical protein
MDEYSGFEGLCDSDRRSVIPYVHERTGVVLLKPAMPEPAYLSPTVKMRLPEPFVAQGRAVILRLGVRQVAPW